MLHNLRLSTSNHLLYMCRLLQFSRGTIQQCMVGIIHQGQLELQQPIINHPLQESYTTSLQFNT